MCLLRVLYVVRRSSLRRADHSSIGVLPTVMCLGPIEETRGGDLCPLGLPSHERRNTFRHIGSLESVSLIVD